ncbi:MAG TPA: OmpA family protein [Aquabacterium sp.]|uniref:OmpA family protein n=1 Tax=Aquabacterium sp. TaxID=1872578 RepID=UPI002E2F7D78|nr:OmpA family protein [Aquabacterium sp.]HEX5374344.1 OmpA family protein [Aquabacterium sp.]
MKHRIHTRLTALALFSTAMAAYAQPALAPIKISPDVINSPYLTDSDQVIVRNSTGLCWRTGYWTPEKAATTSVTGLPLPAGCYCEESMQSKPVCMPSAPVVTPSVTPPPVTVAPAPPAPTSEKVTIPADALFDFDKASLTAEGKTTLDGLLKKMQGINLEAVVAVGYADRIGSTSYNLDLSTRRAESIKNYLVDTGGIAASRVFKEGRGESASVTGDTCKNLGAERGSNKKLVACLAPDRRVVIEAVGAPKP